MEYIHDPKEIERKSFSIIREQLGNRKLNPETESIVLRAIHTTADFEYADNLVFSPGAVAKAREAILSGSHIVTDTNMALSGISKPALKKFGIKAHCYVAEPQVAAAAKQKGITRSMAAVDFAMEQEQNEIFAIGNAPTALYRIRELMQAGRKAPKFIIGVPVGFVNVVEAKEAIMQMDVPYIVARGRKGGSTIAAAIINAILYGME